MQLGGGVFLSHWGVLFLTEHTEFTEYFCAQFEPTERLRHTEVTERFSYYRTNKGQRNAYILLIGVSR